jgi:hypothetical protein
MKDSRLPACEKMTCPKAAKNSIFARPLQF